MAAGSLPAIGTEYGPCEGVCCHSDCMETRRMAESRCSICNEKIGYETSFYEVKMADLKRWFGETFFAVGTVRDCKRLVHYTCLHQKMDHQIEDREGK